MKVSNVFNLLPDSLESLDAFQLGIENELYEEGNVYAYEVLAKLRLMEKLVKSMTKSPRFMHAVSSELSEKENDYGLYTIKESSRTSYNFKTNERYKELELISTEAKDNLKTHTDFLKTIPEEGLVDEDTGEIFEAPEKMKSTTIITVSWKKQKAAKDYKEISVTEKYLPFD